MLLNHAGHDGIHRFAGEILSRLRPVIECDAQGFPFGLEVSVDGLDERTFWVHVRAGYVCAVSTASRREYSARCAPAYQVPRTGLGGDAPSKGVQKAPTLNAGVLKHESRTPLEHRLSSRSSLYFYGGRDLLNISYRDGYSRLAVSEDERQSEHHYHSRRED